MSYDNRASNLNVSPLTVVGLLKMIEENLDREAGPPFWIESDRFGEKPVLDTVDDYEKVIHGIWVAS